VPDSGHTIEASIAPFMDRSVGMPANIGNTANCVCKRTDDRLGRC